MAYRAIAARLLIVVAAFVGAHAPGTARAQGADWAAVQAAAEKVGVVTIYHNLVPPGDEAVFAAFQKAYPKIKVEHVRLGSASLIQRFNTEYAAGVSRADAVLVVWDEVVNKWITDGWIRQWQPPAAKAYPAGYVLSDRVFTTQLYREVLVYNATRVKAADAPKEWADLLNPKWKDKIGMNAPWRSVTVQGAVAYWDKVLGIKNVAQQLKDNGVRFFNGSSGVMQAVLRGDVWVGELIDPPVITALADGAPIKAVYPASGVPAIPGQAFVPEKAPTPAAGMVFVNWLLSEPGQTELQDKMGSPAALPSVRPPKNVPANKDLKIVMSPTLLQPDYQKAMLNDFRSVFNVQ